MAEAKPAYLWVLADPGTEATVEEFNDWYDNEHVPLRMGHISEFKTGARYQASDDQFPGWAAAYSVESTALFSDPKYTVLRANRSPREGNLVGRLAVLDRRTAQVISMTSPPPPAEEAAKFVLSICDDSVPSKDLNEDFGPSVHGWKRSHAHHIYDCLVIGFGKKPLEGAAPNYVTFHEFDDESYLDTERFKTLVEGKKEVRRWKLWKATPNTASK